MKRTALTVLAASAALAAWAFQPTPQQVDSVSAAMATTFIENVRPALDRFKAQGLPIDDEIFGRYIAKGLAGEPTGFTPQSAGAYMEAFMQEMQKGDTVSVASQKEWLARVRAENPEARVTDDGVILVVVAEGDGFTPTGDDKVEVAYKGLLSDGTVFDDSKGETITFGLNQVIPGFTQGLKMMSHGGRYKLYIPSEMAYGTKGIPGVIPGNAALLFDIEYRGQNGDKHLKDMDPADAPK